MVGLLTLLLVTLGITTCGGQYDDKILLIHADMDMDDDGFVVLKDLEDYFAVYTNFLSADSLDYFVFSFVWSLVYNDTDDVIQYIFDSWDQNVTDNVITNGDITYLFNTMDTNLQPTPGFLQYDVEFLPYFRQLYQNAYSFASSPVGKRDDTST